MTEMSKGQRVSAEVWHSGQGSMAIVTGTVLRVAGAKVNPLVDVQLDDRSATRDPKGVLRLRRDSYTII